jgi:formylglycine-generating enzyme required for sulfatase activity
MPATTDHRDPPKVPNHELIRVIGRGAYGEIWMARSELGVLRAVKLVDRRTFESEKAFQREFEGMARFEPISREHTGFVDILHVGRDEGGEFFYYVMELADDHVDGQRIDPAHYVPKTLKTELARRSRLLAEEVITLGLSLTESLAALHREGLVHRDIKLANIIFAGGRPKIADIGLVAASGQESFVGTEGYVPPEGPGSAQGDIFSLGKVLYELGMGKDRMDFPALHTRLDHLPDKEVLLRLNEVFLRACANDPSERYTRVEQMHQDLARLRDGRPLQQWGKRRWPWVIAALFLLTAIAAGAYFFRLKTARGAVRIETDPEGAMVVIGDRMVRTPAHFEKLPIGEHEARIMMPGYEPQQQRVLIEANADGTLPKIKLVRSRGALRLAAKPDGATYELANADGIVKAGTFPAELSDLSTGEYSLIARRDGREKKMKIEVKRGEMTPVEVEFLSGKISVASQPPGAEIFVDGQPFGKAPLELSLSDGPHELIARYSRWPEQKRTLAINPAQPADVRFEFLPGRVKITSAPGGASVMANGQDMGRTPLLLENVEPGAVHYELHLAGFQPLALDGEVKAGEQTFLGGRFMKRAGPQRGQPWENSLGMRFLPVGEVLIGVWPVRVREFDAFCVATSREPPKPDFAQDENHPVVLVSHEDAKAFCDWLTRHELAAERLAEGQHYRLPSDVEWSAAAGLSEEGRATPEERDGKVREFSWGRGWPPPAHSGNFADGSLRRTGQATISGYQDGFPQTSPVGSFPPNKMGLYDMSGNVWQWILEPYNPTSRWGVLRGGSWADHKPAELSLSYRNVVDPSGREVIYGFRCVIASEALK